MERLTLDWRRLTEVEKVMQSLPNHVQFTGSGRAFAGCGRVILFDGHSVRFGHGGEVHCNGWRVGGHRHLHMSERALKQRFALSAGQTTQNVRKVVCFVPSIGGTFVK